MKRRPWLSAAFAVAASLGADAFADYACEKGYRDTTPAERAAETHALETIRAALPAASAGWVLLGDDKISVTQSLCADFDGTPWRYSFNREYQRVDDRAQRDELIAQAAEVMQADAVAKQPQLDALMAKIQALTNESIAAAQAGDFARVDAISQQNAALTEQYQQLVDTGPDRTRADALLAQASRDQSMWVSVDVNQDRSPLDGAVTLPLPAGARSAYRWSETRGDVNVDHVLVLLGQPPPDAATATPTAVRAVAVDVTADAERIAATVAAIDFAALAALLQ
jgi:hypothetical protein